MVGYSRLMEADEADTLARQNAIRADLIDPAIETHRGRIVKGTGDGLLAEFSSAVDAVECAVEIQREMNGRDIDIPAERRIQFRIGINVGDIVFEDGDIFGDGVNVAARIESLANPGGILLSGSAHHQVVNKLDLGFEDLGLLDLKNLERPVQVYRVLLDLSAAETLPGHQGRPKLKQRKIVQWALAYFASAWLSLELFDLVAEQFLWPIWVRQGATILLLFGLLITLVLAWYHGEKGRQKISPAELVLLTALLVLAGGSVWTLKNRSVDNGAAQSSVTGFSFRPQPSPENSVAVLPCSNLSGHEDHEYFADGLAAELITRLSAVSELRVPSQTSSFTFKGRSASIDEVASALRVRHVLECGVVGEGSRLRISARLVDVESGYALWSDAYDREAEGLLEVQQEIAQAVVASLQLELRGDEPDRLAKTWTNDPQAYDHFLRGIRLQNSAPTVENIELARHHFERAIDLDSTFGRAYGRLAVQWIVVGNLSMAPAEKAYAEVDRIARQALELDDELFEAYWALGWADLAYRHSWQEARANFQRTITLAPGEWAGYHSLGYVEGLLGRTDAGLEAARIGFDLDPFAYYPRHGLEVLYTRRRDYDAAHRELEALIEMMPGDPSARAYSAIILARAGRDAEARQDLEAAAQLASNDSDLSVFSGSEVQLLSAQAYTVLGDSARALSLLESVEGSMNEADADAMAGLLAGSHAILGHDDEAMRWLARVRETHNIYILFLDGAEYDSLRGDPRFAALIRELRLPEDVYLRTKS